MKKSKKERILEMLDIPKEVVLDLPKVTIYNDNQVVVENYSGLLEYTSESIRLKTSGKSISIRGLGLELRTVTDIDVLVEGKIKAVEFI
ncbi:MAG: YabP/YqfC family sporulation protein [Eubacteriales bacterium]|jgi:sporulation protein YqfC|nr:YabP/YqfC family sporulation protein [Eubacteriales bacterium]